MGFFSRLSKNLASFQPKPEPIVVTIPEVVAKPKKPRKPRAVKAKVIPPVDPVIAAMELIANKRAVEKAAATDAGQPWVDVVQVTLDPDNVGNGNFELDFNDIFLAKLLRAGYKGKTDYDIVEQWFVDVCRNIVLETFEQHEADPANRGPVSKNDLGNGKSEYQ